MKISDKRSIYSSSFVSGTFVAVLLAACAVGPDFVKPTAPSVKRYTDTELPIKTASTKTVAGAAQSFTQDKDIPANWWTLFGSDSLNTMVADALTNNPDIKAAEAALKQAQENVYAQIGDFYPSIDLSLAPQRQQFSTSAYGNTKPTTSIYTLYNAKANVSYNLDVFGGTRRAVESLEAQADYQRFQLEATYLSLTSNVVTTAFLEASLRKQITATEDIITFQRDQRDLLKKQVDLGAVAKTALLEQEATLAQTQATLPVLRKSLALARNQLATLTGRVPSEDAHVALDLNAIHLPEEIPLSLPSKLVEQRPDIKAAQAQLQSANALVGIAIANQLPQISLTGSYGSGSTTFSKLFTSPTEVWSVGGGLVQPIFHGGTLLHERRAAVEGYNKTYAQYQSVVLQAFQNVSDSLRALQLDAEALQAQLNAEEAAKNSLALVRVQYQDGAISYSQLLDVQRTYQQAAIALVKAQEARFSDTAALFHALGGGWWNRVPTEPASSTKSVAAPTNAIPASSEKERVPSPAPTITELPFKAPSSISIKAEPKQ